MPRDSEEDLDAENEELCEAKYEQADKSQRKNHRETAQRTPSYDKDTNICTIVQIKYSCTKYKNKGCKEWNNGVETKSTIQMPKSSD